MPTTEARPFTEVPLSEIVDNGVLFEANYRFFWPLGLALTYLLDEYGTVSGLHVRQWEPAEVIEDDPADPIFQERRAAFDRWEAERRKTLIP